MAKKIFILSFLVAFVIQGFIFIKIGIVDLEMWANQAQYVQTDNPGQFDFSRAYGHPGGPIIEFSIFAHKTFGVSYQNSILIYIVFLDSLIIAASAALCYKLWGNNLLWPIVTIGLSSNWVYAFSTPPSITSSILLTFLCLLSLYIYKVRSGIPLFALWTLVAGLSAATRIDISSVITMALIIFLKPKVSWREFFGILLATFVFFIIFDPFMWFMPLQHIKDLIFKIFYHYDQIDPSKIGFSLLATISSPVILGIFFSTALLIAKKESLPGRFILVLIVTTVFLYIIFLSAKYKAPRYFVPTMNIWQTFLPVSIFALTENIKPRFRKMTNVFFVAVLTVSPILFILILC